MKKSKQEKQKQISTKTVNTHVLNWISTFEYLHKQTADRYTV